jgi:rod shape determining protein RodA
MFRKIDAAIIVAGITLSILGLIMIFSTGGLTYFLKQLGWLTIALIICYLFSAISPRVWASLSPFVYAGLGILLVLVIVAAPGYPNRWFKFGDVSIQPSEFAKFATILILANYLANRKRLDRFVDIIVPFLIIAVPAALVFVEPDLGAAQIFFPILIVMLYWSGMPGAKIFIFFSPILSAIASFSIYIWIGYIVLLGIYLFYRKKLGDLVYGLVGNPVAGLMTPVIWNSLKPYQQKRVIAFLSPWLDPQGMSWQVIQSKIAIGSGRLLGKGFLSGTQKKFEFLPERHTDFIFSCIGEEFGLLGIIVTLGLYVFLLYRIINLAREAKNKFSGIFAIGVMGWFGYQALINTAMTLGLIPITGVPLPFISYGGSALLACFMAVGVMLSISKSKLEY